MRLFYAIELPDSLKKGISVFQEQAKASGLKGSWTRGETMHLTLVFLGEQLPSGVSGLLGIMREVAEDIKPFSLTTSACGAFPSISRGSVFWLGLEKSSMLALSARRLAESLMAKNAVFDRKPFHPHLTLARFRDPVDVHGFDKNFPTESFEVHELVLFESVFSKEGVYHIKRGSSPFGKNIG